MTESPKLTPVTVAVMTVISMWVPAGLLLIIDGLPGSADLFLPLTHVGVIKIIMGITLLGGVGIVGKATKPFALMTTRTMALQRLGLWLCLLVWSSYVVIGTWYPPRWEALGSVMIPVSFVVGIAVRIWQIGRDIKMLEKAANQL